VLVLHTTTVSYDGDEDNGDADEDGMGNKLFDIHSVVDECSRQKMDLFEYKKGLKFQLHELQSMLHGMKKDANVNQNIRSTGVKGDASGQGDEIKVGGMSAASAIFADILLQMRTQHGEYWGPLGDAERGLWKSIKEDNRRVTNMLREERISQQTDDLRRELQIVDGDDVEVEMFMEDWLTKLAALDNAHRSNLHQFAAERARTSVGTGTGVGAGSSSESKSKGEGEGDGDGEGEGEGEGGDEGGLGDEQSTMGQSLEEGSVGESEGLRAEGSRTFTGSSSGSGSSSSGAGRGTGTGCGSSGTGSGNGSSNSSSSSGKSSSSTSAVGTGNGSGKSSSSTSTSVAGTSSSSNHRGWSDHDHDIFAKVFRRAQSNGMQRRLFLEALRAQLPGRSEGDILAHEEWYRQMRVIAARQVGLKSFLACLFSPVLTSSLTSLHHYPRPTSHHLAPPHTTCASHLYLIIGLLLTKTI
jgi:hypothetical protein